jgi:hypothetical protein
MKGCATMARHNKVFRALGKAFQSRPRYSTVLPEPMAQNSNFYHTAGPVFNPGADGAILNSKLSKPWQVLWGYAYRVANPQKFTPYQPAQLYAPKGVPMVGINIQLPDTTVTTPSVNSDGTFANEGIFAYSPDGSGSTVEGEW